MNELDWIAIEDALNADGYAHLPSVVSKDACSALRSLYDDDAIFRSRIVMERHRFGRGEYKYFAYPLPQRVAAMREDFYTGLAPVANRWNQRLGSSERYPAELRTFLESCHAHQQVRPTPLMLRYTAGDYNCLHQDTYGAIAFPFQATVFLSSREEYTGGEFVLTEQRPRSQSRPIVVVPDQGDCLIFANRYKPTAGKNGYHRTAFRHGVSTVRSGERFTLGIIFHDAE